MAGGDRIASLGKKIRTWCPYVKKKLETAAKEEKDLQAARLVPQISGDESGQASTPNQLLDETKRVNRRLWTIWIIGMWAVTIFAALSVLVLGWNLKYVLVFLVFIPILITMTSSYVRRRTDSPWEPSYHRIGRGGAMTSREWKEVRRTRLRTSKPPKPK